MNRTAMVSGILAAILFAWSDASGQAFTAVKVVTNGGTYAWSAAPWVLTNKTSTPPPSGVTESAWLEGGCTLNIGPDDTLALGCVAVFMYSYGLPPPSTPINYPGANVNMTGGSLTILGTNMDSHYLSVGDNTTSTFTQVGGTVSTPILIVGRGGTGVGTYNLNGGLLQIGSNGITRSGGSGTINLNGGTLQATASTNWTVSQWNVMSNGAVIDTQGFSVSNLNGMANGGVGGGLVKLGTGLFSINGDATYTGLTSISNGTLQIGNNNASANVGGGSFMVATGATLRFCRNIGTGSGAKFTTQSISGGGDVAFWGQSSGWYTIGFNNTYLGTLSYTGKTIVQLDAGGALWLEKDDVLPHATLLNMISGNVSMRNQTGSGITVTGLVGNAGTFITTDQDGAHIQKFNLVLGSGQTNTYAGTIGAMGTYSNNISLSKSGDGTQILAGNNTYAGSTKISGGQLLVNGTLTNSAVSVLAGGTLGGTGSVGAVTVTNGAAITAGDTTTVGTLALSSLTMKEGAQVVWNYASGVGDVITVSGALQLATNATVTVTGSGLRPSSGVVMFSGGTLSGATNLGAWAISGSGALPGMKAVKSGNQVLLRWPTRGTSVFFH